MQNITSILLAILGAVCSATGSVIQKSGSPWMGWKGKKDKRFLKYFFIWVGGFYLFNLAIIPNGLASKVLPPYIISSVSGLGVPFIILLSFFFLREKIYSSDIVYSFIIAAAIFVMCIVQKSSDILYINKIAIYILLILPIFIVLPAFFKKTGPKMKTILFSSYSGITAGLAIVLMNVAVKECGSSVSLYLHSPYLYLWIGIGVLSQVAVQFAYKSGDMILIGPIQNSFTILYPAVCSFFIFNTPLYIAQMIAMVFIIFSCIAILKKH
ncbi:MAG: hypothetical protein Q8942_09120 [Bacillota bacterium]|nr:hypothetical protein [Bacillota bacterium]